MSGFEPLLGILLVLAWVVGEIWRRVARPPRPLGTIEEEPAEEPAPPPVRSRSRATAPLPKPVEEAHAWGSDRAQFELRSARELGIRQARRQQLMDSTRGPRRHPRRPRLHDPGALRDAMVLTTILGPCRTDQPYDGQRH